MGLQRLRIDVDDGREARLAHSGSRGGKEARRSGGERARLVGLPHKLRPVATTQTQKRRRTKEFAIRQLTPELFERAHRGFKRGTRHNDAHEVAKRWVAEQLAPFELLTEETADVMAGGIDDRACVGLERLHDHATRSVATAAARELRDQLERPLLGPEVGQRERRIGVDHRGKLDPRKVVALRNHLCAKQDRAIRRNEPLKRRGELLRLVGGVGVESDQLKVGKVALKVTLELLGASPEPGELNRAARRARLGRPLTPAAVMASQLTPVVQDERHIAIGAPEGHAARAAMQRGRRTAPVEQQDRLTAPITVGNPPQSLQQRGMSRTTAAEHSRGTALLWSSSA